MMKKKIWIPLVAAGSVVLLAAIGAILLWANRFRIDITLKGEPEITLEYGSAYADAGADGFYRGKLFMKKGKPVELSIDNPVDPAKVGTYTITYSAEKWNRTATATRKVEIVDTQAPTLTLQGDAEMTITKGKTFQEPGFTASDGYDGDLREKVMVSGQVDADTAGEYTLTYTVADSSGNSASATRKVTVKAPVVKPQSVTPAETGTVSPGEKPAAFSAQLPRSSLWLRPIRPPSSVRTTAWISCPGRNRSRG